MIGIHKPRLGSLFTGALVAATTTLAWGQIPIVSPANATKPAQAEREIPIIQARTAAELPAAVPIVKSPLKSASAPSERQPAELLPAIVRPDELAGQGLAAQGTSLPPIVRRPTAPLAFPSQSTAPLHPDVSMPGNIPDEIPVIKAEVISPKSPANSSPAMRPELSAALIPVIQAPRTAVLEVPFLGGDPSLNWLGEPTEMEAAVEPTAELMRTHYLQQNTDDPAPMSSTPIVPSIRSPAELFPRSPVESQPRGWTQAPLTPAPPSELDWAPSSPGQYLPASRSSGRPSASLPSMAFPRDGQPAVNYAPNSGGLHQEMPCPNCGGAGCEHCQGMMPVESVPVAGDGSWVEETGCWDECQPSCFGFMPCASRYFIFDGLYWTRNDGEIAGTNFGGISDYEWDFGARVTIGRRVDAIAGYELSYLGLLPLDAQVNQASGIGAIDALFVPGGGFGAVQTGAFFNAIQTTQTVQTRLHAVEFNRVRWGWDVVQTNVGLRYLWFEDDYKLESRNIFANTGTFALSAVNQLIGPEIGLSLFYDVGRRISFSSFGKLGGYVNFYRTDLDLINGGVHYLSNRHSEVDFSATLDLGVNAHVHIARGVRLRGGYGAMWLWDVTSSADNFPDVLRPTTGFNPDDTDTVFFHGANVGLEFYR